MNYEDPSHTIVIKGAATVGGLLAALKRVPLDTLVMQSRDTEGNGFLPLLGVSVGRYLPAEDEMLSIDGEVPTVEHHNVICLWPAHDWQHAQMIVAARTEL